MPSLSDAVTAADVDEAAGRVAMAATVTPVHPNARLSRATGLDVWLKREDLQPARSYKVRGAYNLIAQLAPDELTAGVVCASAGNHAQGVAQACAALGVQARIFLPRTTPRQKRQRVARIGGQWVETVIVGDYFEEAAAAARQDATDRGPRWCRPSTTSTSSRGRARSHGRSSISSTGHRTASSSRSAVPVCSRAPSPGSSERHPSVRVVGVEPAGAASLTAALAAGRPVTLESVDTFVDGAAVARVGDLTFDLVRSGVDDVVTVPEGMVCQEMIDLYQEDGIIAEPAGALASAAVRSGLGLEPGARVVCLVSGGNNDLSRYAEVVERALVHEGCKHYFLVEFPQEPGALRRFLNEVLGPDDDITLFEYVKRNNREVGPALVGVELSRPDDINGLLARMEASPLKVTRLPPGSPMTRFLV